MTRLVYSLGVAAILGALAAPALAQTTTTASPPLSTQSRSLAPGAAAATLPNSFDRPVARTAPAPVAAPAAPATVPTAAQVTEAEIAEGVLRAVIADLAESRLDAELFTPALAGRLTPQLPTLGPVVQEFGMLGPIEAQGATNGANQFLVTFENAVTQWVIGMDEDGRISALLFRPAPPASSEPEGEQAEPETPVAATPDAASSDDDR